MYKAQIQNLTENLKTVVHSPFAGCGMWRADASVTCRRVGKYEIGKTIGQGSFAKVKYALDTETGEAVAIKILDKEKIHALRMGEQVKREIALMKMVKHPHVVNLLEVLASRTKVFIVLELVTGAELSEATAPLPPPTPPPYHPPTHPTPTPPLYPRPDERSERYV